MIKSINKNWCSCVCVMEIIFANNFSLNDILIFIMQNKLCSKNNSGISRTYIDNWDLKLFART